MLKRTLPKMYTENLPQYTIYRLFDGSFDDTVRKRSSLYLEGYEEKVFERVNQPEEADYILIPHSYFQIKKEQDYLKRMEQLALKHGKRIIMITGADFDDHIPIMNALIMRVSQYRYKQASNEIIIPPFARDLQKEISDHIEPRSLYSVAFCGWAGYASPRSFIAEKVKNAKWDILSFIKGSHMKAHKKGRWYRRKALKELQAIEWLDSNFIIRSSFGGHSSTAQVDIETARQDYINNILESNFALCVKGDGNHSIRFFEVLSAGRIPLLIDTERYLPFEDEIDYSKFVVRVSYKDLGNLDSVLKEKLKSLTESDIDQMRKNARKAYEEHLSSEAIAKKIMSREFLDTAFSISQETQKDRK